MAWKQVFYDEGKDNCWWLETLCAYFPNGYTRSSQHRITVEEEVNECCERWRGGTVRGTISKDGHIAGISKNRPMFVASFCPECGQRL